MSTDPQAAPRALPDRPNLRHLKDQAKDLVKAGSATSLADAQFKVARTYGFSSWPKLKAHIDSLEEVGQLKDAIDRNDLERVKTIMTRNPALHHAPLGYGKAGPLTWVAECRVPWESPSPARLAMAKWMIENGSDVNQGGGGPLGRATLNAYRIPMMELLVAHGADVNAGHDSFPIIFSPCESMDPEVVKWLLGHGANPNCGNAYGRTSALDYLLLTYARSPERMSACIDALLAVGGTTKYSAPGLFELLRGQLDRLTELLDADSTLAHKRFPDLDFGSTGARDLTLVGATLLHVAADFGFLDAARLLLDRGADVNARATIDATGVGGQTPLFHAVTQFDDDGLPMAELLVDRGADLTTRVKIPGHYEKNEIVECTPLGYARRFLQESYSKGRTVAFLHERGAIE
jgi:ankyrin repeat protein